MGKEFKELYERAYEEGLKAGKEAFPTPMVIKGYAPIMDGVCGFAWVNVKPGNSKFANYLKKNGYARKSYGGGVDIWIGEFGQSMDRKEKMAYKMAEIFREAGIRAYANSRMD